MAARDGNRVGGVYHFDCEACGTEATARRAHARSCSAKCAADLRESDRQTTGSAVKTDLHFYLTREKLRRALEAVEERPETPIELVVGVRRGSGVADLGQLCIDQKGDGGLVFRLEAPVSPFDE